MFSVRLFGVFGGWTISEYNESLIDVTIVIQKALGSSWRYQDFLQARPDQQTAETIFAIASG